MTCGGVKWYIEDPARGRLTHLDLSDNALEGPVPVGLVTGWGRRSNNTRTHTRAFLNVYTLVHS